MTKRAKLAVAFGLMFTVSCTDGVGNASGAETEPSAVPPAPVQAPSVNIDETLEMMNDRAPDARKESLDAKAIDELVADLAKCKGDNPYGCEAAKRLMRVGPEVAAPLVRVGLDPSKSKQHRSMAMIVFNRASEVKDPALVAELIAAAAKKPRAPGKLPDYLLTAAAKCDPTNVGPILELYIEGEAESWLTFGSVLAKLDKPAATQWLLANFPAAKKEAKIAAGALRFTAAKSDLGAVNALVDKAEGDRKLSLASVAIKLGDANRYDLFVGAIGTSLERSAMIYLSMRADELPAAVKSSAVAALEKARAAGGDADLYAGYIEDFE